MGELILIAAIAASNRAIGYGGKLPWDIPADLKRFRQLTLNHTVIMGRKTWEFDLQKRPLPQRLNVIVSSQIVVSEANVVVVRSLSDALQQSGEKLFIIGGATIYAQSLDLVDRLELTIVEGNYRGDVFFPEFRDRIGSQFELINLDPQEGYRFETYQRIQNSISAD